MFDQLFQTLKSASVAVHYGQAFVKKRSLPLTCVSEGPSKPLPEPKYRYPFDTDTAFVLSTLSFPHPKRSEDTKALLPKTTCPNDHRFVEGNRSKLKTSKSIATVAEFRHRKNLQTSSHGRKSI